MNHRTLTRKAAIAADTVMHAAKHLAIQTFNEPKPLMVHRHQVGQDAIEVAEAIHLLTAQYFDLCAFISYAWAVEKTEPRIVHPPMNFRRPDNTLIDPNA